MKCYLPIQKHLRFFKKRLLLPVMLAMAFAPRLQAQGYIEHSRVIGDVGGQVVNDMAVDASGNSYIVARTNATNYPVTIGPVPATNFVRPVLIKLNPSGNRVWARYLPFSATNTGTNIYGKMLEYNGTLYLLGVSGSPDLPVTDGSVSGGGGNDIVFTKVDAGNGTILHNGYIGGSGNDGTISDMFVDNGDVYISYATNSPNIPVTTGPAYTTGYDNVLLKLDAAGNTIYNTYVGNLSAAVPAANTGNALFAHNGTAYLTLVVNSPNNFVTTDGSTGTGGPDFAILRLDASGNRTLAKIIGGTGIEAQPRLFVNNGDIYLSGNSVSTNYPVTDGSSRILTSSVVLTKVNSSGNIVFSGYRAGTASSVGSAFGWANGALYFGFAGSGASPSIQTTDGSDGGSVLMKINPVNGIAQAITKFGQLRSTIFFTNIEMVVTDAVYISSPIQGNSNPLAEGFTTDGSTWQNGRSGTFVTKHNLDGRLLFSTYLRGPNSGAGASTLFHLGVANGKMYLSGASNPAVSFPVTDSPLGTLNDIDASWTVYNFCPPMPIDNTITPLSQSICQNGFTQTLSGNEVAYTSAQMPTLYVNGAPQQQVEIRARYQWQVATSASGPWTNNSGTQRDYTPTPGAQTFYYRRLVLPPAGCGDIPVSISPVAEVVIGANAAPTVTGGIFNTCAGTAVNISATASGGTTPYTYAWDNGIGSITNTATVTPATNSVYTLTVTDANGCQQIGQAIVNAYAADAGPATVSSCAGNPVRIGAAPPAGLAGVTYSWTPVTGLDDPTIAQPLATPASTTVYTLQMTVPVSGGGSCVTSDNVTVNVVAGPVTPDFAGADQATCKGGNIALGTSAEAGFTYTWSPGSYLSSTVGSTNTFNAGTNLPQPNPFTYTLTASNNGCSFTDQVRVAVLEVDAGEDYCGPRTVGTADKMPGVTGKTWLWEVVSGPGTITGATNTPTTTVSASASPTTYRVTVSYLGANCSDEVVVASCGGGGCDVEIDTLANHGCPSTVFGSVSLRAKPSNLDPSAWTYTWSSVPAGGLSATTGATITLTDNVERDVTVTVSRVDNPSVTCSETIHVNDPSWALPVFNAPDQTICPAASVAIGTAPVSGYLYTWQNVTPADINSYNPIVSPSSTRNYPVTIADVGSGCSVHDTVIVTVKPLIINPGPDWVSCSNASIILGSPALPGYTYSWSPQVAAYQNGTTYQSAEPQVLIATTQDFTLTVTDTQTGCTADSTVHIVIDPGNTLPAMSDTTICSGGSAIIGLPEWGGVTYSWSPATGLSSTTVAQPIASPATTQTYTLIVTFYDAGGAPVCSKTGTVTVTVAAPQITMSDESICPSGPLYNLNNGVTATGATSYSWSPALLVTNPGALNTTVKANPNTPTTFTLTATDANGCEATASKVVSPTNPAPEAGGQGFVCVGDNRTLGSSANTGTLSWTVNPAIAGTLTPANGAQPIFTPAAGDAGKTFTFILTQDIAGCINIDSVRILVRSLALPAMPAQTVCMNAPATIGVTPVANVTYAWTPATGLTDPNAATTTVSNVTGNNIYTLTATDVYGCSASATAAVGMNPVPAPSVMIPTVTVPLGSSGVPFSPQVTPAGSYSYTWTPANGVNNPYISNATALPGPVGYYNYNLSVTDGNGCTTIAPATLIVTINTLPVTLSAFEGSVQNCGVGLKWKVASADKFSHFVIERNDGRGFRPVSTIYYHVDKEQYHFQDTDPGNGNWTYRLRLVDIDGRYTYSAMVLAKVNCTSKETLVVYPNPMNDKLYINSSKPVKKISLFSIGGQLLMQRDYRQGQAGVILLPVDNQIAQGIYLLQVIATDGTMQNTRLIKQ